MPWYNLDYTGNATMLFNRALLLFQHTFDVIFSYANSNLFIVLMLALLLWMVFGFLCYLIRKNKK